MKSAICKWMALVGSVAVAMVFGLGMTVAAHAAALAAPPEGTYLVYNHGGAALYIGAIAQSEQGMAYCIEAGKAAELSYDQVLPVQDGDPAARVAWLADRYRDSRDPMIHAGIGVLAHQYFDLNAGAWQQHWESIKAQHPTVESMATKLWDEAGRGMPANIQASYAYTEGMRSGVVRVGVLNADGTAVPGVRYTVTLSGPAQFADGGDRISGVSGQSAVEHAWHATGAGDVTVSTTYERPSLQQLVSNQDFIRFAGNTSVPGTGVRFSVRKDFTPSLSTRAAATIVDAGQLVADVVTSGVAGESDHWVPGLELQATGWYFDGLESDELGEGMVPEPEQTATAFLQRLSAAGYEPAGYGEAVFSAPGQSVEVQAHTVDGEPYQASDTGGFGTWVWAFERQSLSEQAKEYVLNDVVTPFLDIAETNVNRARVGVESTVTEHSAAVGAELSDTITVTGFPDDHGAFTGNEALGLQADDPSARVRVWWAGDPDNPANDGAYRPNAVDEPQEDANHRLIGEWEYPAVNGTIRVGGGSPDAQGNPVHITAETHGWYVFVYEFQGDDRVMPVASAYDDAWERTRVELYDTPERPALTTQVDPETVRTNEPFHDTARITGDVPEGAYVQFDAYEAVGPDDRPGTNGKLMDAHRVPVDHTRAEQTVTSPEARSAQPGLVYWQAILYSAEGDILAAHELGAEGEIVTVTEPADPESAHATSLPTTGSNLLAIFVVGVAALAVGGFMVVAIRRRS